MMLANLNIIAAESSLSEAGDSLKEFFSDGSLSGIWTLLAYLGGALIIIALVMTAIGYIQQAAQGGRGGGGGGQQNKTLAKMLVFGVLMAGPQTWMPVAIDLIVAVLDIILNLISGVVEQLGGDGGDDG